MSNSTITLQTVVDSASNHGELAPSLATGGFSLQPALDIANDVIAELLLGGPRGEIMNWKFNRLTPFPTFLTNSWQQDYFIPNLVNLGWIEKATSYNINQTSAPKENFQLEVVRELDVTYAQTAQPAKICWLPNNQLTAGTWGATAVSMPLGLTNPGPGVKYINPINQPQQPTNPITQVADAFGNLWVLTTYGTCGNTNPFLTNLNPVYPTYTNPSVVATTVTDGTVVWTAVNPWGQGFRLAPIPPQTGLVWLIQVVPQMRVPVFTALSQTLDPVPDDYATYFKQGFYAQCYRRSPDAKVRAKFTQEWQMWLESLDKAVRQGQREKDDYGFYPTRSIMDTGFAPWLGPANPYMWGPWNG